MTPDQRLTYDHDLTDCPACGAVLVGYRRSCRECGADVLAWLEAARKRPPTSEASAIPDNRPERDIRIGIKRALWAIPGWRVWDMEQERPTRQDPGPSDLLVMGWGRIVFAEIKRPKGTQSEAQVSFEGAVEENGGTYLVWRSEADAIAFAEEIMDTERRTE